MKLSLLLHPLSAISAVPDLLRDAEIIGITADSRSVRPGSLFVAIRGEKSDGRNFLNEVFEKGAVAAIYDGEALPENPRLFRVDDARASLAHLASIFYSHPSLALPTIGVTGTSGKTSVGWIFAQTAARLGAPSFYGGTLGFRVFRGTAADREPMKELSNTTMDALSNQAILRQSVDEGAKAAIFEATSQGLVQKRTKYIDWKGAIFTNLSRDHLDLHGTMAAYEQAKRILFFEELVQSVQEKKFAVISTDDQAGAGIARDLRRLHPEIRTITFGTGRFPTDTSGSVESTQSEDDFQLGDIKAGTSNIQFSLRSRAVRIAISAPLIGEHSAQNLACAVLSLFALGYAPEQIASAISEIPAVPGRLEPVISSQKAVYIDYAHKPDGLEKVQKFLKPLAKGRLITVFGCGGDRDKGKRPVMGKIVEDLADVGIVTSDNPRTEAPDAIIEDILQGMGGREGFEKIVQADRRKAIVTAIEMARPQDIVLIAGKGHEPYQEIHGVKHHFSDLEEAKKVLGLE